MGVHQPPDPAQAIAALTSRIEELERIVRRGKPEPNMRDLNDGDLAKALDGQVPAYDKPTGKWRSKTTGIALFHYSGTLTVAASDRWYHPYPFRISTMAAALTTSGSTTTTVVLGRNGVAISGATISFTSGQSGLKTATFTGVNFAITDYLTAAITAAGTGAAGLVVRTA